MTDDAGPDLSLVTTDAMVDELRRRFDCLLIVAEKDVGGDDVAYRRHWHGPYSRVIGMCSRFRRWLIRLDDSPGADVPPQGM